MPFAAKQGDRVVATDMHLIQPPGPVSPILVPHPFSGIIDGSLSSDVQIMGKPAATLTSTATNTPPHVPIGGTFVKPPANRATIISGSGTVLINNKPAAVMGSQGLNAPPHVGLHASDPFLVPTMQVGRVTSGSPTVFFENRPAASGQSMCMMCMSPGTLAATGMTVVIG